MICEKCKKESIKEYTSKDNEIICEECLEKEIYKERERIYKKDKKQRVIKKVSNLLIGIFIGFGISYITVMLIMIIKLLIR